MCLGFFVYNPTPNYKFMLLFNRDEAATRERTKLIVTDKGVLCGLDIESKGTWLGINIKSGNFRFLTNYAN